MEKNSSNKRTKNSNQRNNTRKNIDNRKNVNSKKANKSKKKVWPKVLLIIVIIVAIAGGVFAYNVHKNGGGAKGVLTTVLDAKKDVGEFQCLILGISTEEKGSLLTDTIMVASYNPNTQKASLLSIPRDTYVGTNPAKATAYQKINSLYGRKHRPDETLEAVNDITNLGIQYYVVVRTEALIELVDAIGGVTFYVPMDMNYDDTNQDLHIHLKEGEQLLDGEKAEQLVRFRHNNNGTSYPVEYGDNDLGRMRTQREFIMATIKQTAKPENIFKIGQILEVAEKNIETNIDFNVAKDYIPYVVEFDTANMITNTLPGESTNKNSSGTWIFVHDEEETEELIQEMFYDRDLEQTTEDEEETVSKADITLEVLNGSGDSSNLDKVVEELEGAGYEVDRKGTTNSTAKTTIINKKDVADTILTNIKQTIGAGTISDSASSSSKVDVTIVIGKDY